MPGIHLDVWGTTWLCEKAREGSRLPPEVRLVCKLASKAKPALQNSSVPFGLAQKHLLFDCLSEVVRPVCLISSEFPESCSCLPFTMMEKSPLPDVRSNLIVAAGDLAIRFWDLLEPWTSPLCARLQDPCPGVKQTAGPVLTHVPLQDTVTGKGQVSDMATVLLEQDEEVVAVPEVFLAELGKRAIGCLGGFSHKSREGLLEAGCIP
ncbi:hypothetical protein DUI87_31053 [Hirundo rustica rustica]|uniref:Condensin complex subunit 1 C-terminal domain-containing protein n=1 Tax=Hirundo rustica rustica TaxID=333673 RepID=A0A3M0IUH8_HIRRU|nr:hypothetical protein DUI87_31053 [Hirundo rustica rustica]